MSKTKTPTNGQFAFNEHQMLHNLKHYLPTQGPLKDFVHHNSLHAFQDMKFYDAIFKASSIFGFRTTFTLNTYRNLYKIGRITPEILNRVIAAHTNNSDNNSNNENLKSQVLEKHFDETINSQVGALRREWAAKYPIDLDNAVQPLLFRIICSYLDQGIAITPFPFEDTGLLNAVSQLEENSMASFFKTKQARELLKDSKQNIKSLLEILVGDEKFFEEYIYDQQFGHRGWSGMVAMLEDNPSAIMYAKKISLKDFIQLELLLEIDALTSHLGNNWQPLGEITKLEPTNIFTKEENSSNQLRETLQIWQDAFEWSYYDTALAGLTLTYPTTKESKQLDATEKRFQSIFCIDEREYSLRTHVESMDKNIETFGTAGFFGVEFYFQPAHAKFFDKLAPAPVTPGFLIKEKEGAEAKHGKEIMYNKRSHTLVRGVLYSYLLGLPAIGKLAANLINPTMSPAIANAFEHMNPDAELTVTYTGQHDEKSGLQIGFTTEEMANRVEKVLRSIGLIKNFSSLVYVIGHGSSSANNPHHGAHDCGACSGRPGLVNARVFAHMANDVNVRDLLKERSLEIPETTQFIGSMHDTASDEMAYYDETILSKDNLRKHNENIELFEQALNLDAKERSRRFNSINTKQSLTKVRQAIKKRSVSYFEPRPELGHGTNALCIVGRRSLTKNLFLDRRAFLNSYDYRTDPTGELLAGVLAPLGTVCGGINLEYYFSRMDNYKLGAGTKLPHNVMGLIGVSNGPDGDLRPGLPLQMIEPHDPVRLLMVVEHYPDVVLSTIQSNPALYQWFDNEWINLVALNPENKSLHVFKNGAFTPYSPITTELPVVSNLPEMFEVASGMKTNHIIDATQENLPISIIKK